MSLAERLRTLAMGLGLAGAPPAAEGRTPAERERRREFLARSLHENLDAAASAGELGPGGRAAYLAQHLEIYAHRLRGFAPHLAGDELLMNDVAVLVEVGAEATGRELRTGGAPAEALAAFGQVEAVMDSPSERVHPAESRRAARPRRPPARHTAPGGDMTESRQILWRRLDLPGHEAARLTRSAAGWTLAGASVFAHDGRPCGLDYSIECDAEWRTRAATVRGWVGDAEVSVEIEVGPGGRWRLNGAECPKVQGCIDVDLNFSPSTNLLPIRRLRLAIGDQAEVRAAWLRFPGFALEPLPQVYRRLSGDTYRYESAGGAFVRDLAVDDAGFVTSYPGFFEAAGG